MDDKNLVQEFHSDHTKVVGALLDLRQAISRRDPAQVTKTLNQANRLVGPHFKFEERYLYPRLIAFVGEAGLMRLLNEHDGVFRGVGRLLTLTGKDDWSESDAQSAAAALELIWEHPITCDGLSLYIERLPRSVQANLLNRMEELRQEGITLLEYQKERAG